MKHLQYTYNISDLDGKYLTSVVVWGKGNQAVVNAIVELGYNPLLCTWSLLYTRSVEVA